MLPPFFSFLSLRHRGVANGIFSWGVSCRNYKQTKTTRLFCCSHTLVDFTYFQVYFGYGLSFIFGIYVTQLDLFGQVPILLPFFYSGAPSFVAPGILCYIYILHQGWSFVAPGMAGSLRAGRRTWSSPCSSPLPCWRTKKQQFQVFIHRISFSATLHFVLSCERLSLPTIQKNRSMT